MSWLVIGLIGWFVIVLTAIACGRAAAKPRPIRRLRSIK